MAFFDSPKNRALWDKELENLDAERSRRQTEGYKPQQAVFRTADGGDAAQANPYSNNPKVRRITLNELIEIEKRAREAEREAAGMADTRQKHRQGAERSRSASNSRTASAQI